MCVLHVIALLYTLALLTIISNCQTSIDYKEVMFSTLDFVLPCIVRTEHSFPSVLFVL